MAPAAGQRGCGEEGRWDAAPPRSVQGQQTGAAASPLFMALLFPPETH